MTHRPIDISAQAALDPPAITGMPRLEWVDLDRLMIDETYQRPLNTKSWGVIRRIAAGFDWAKFTPIMVAQMPGGGHLALIDGQHRAHGAALAGLTRIPAMIVDIAPDAQAAAFMAINSQRTAVIALHIYRAALTSGEPWTRTASEAVTDAGCVSMTCNYSATSKRPGQIFATALVRDYVKAGGARIVTQGLAATRDGFALLVMGFTGKRAMDWKSSSSKPSTPWRRGCNPAPLPTWTGCAPCCATNPLTSWPPGAQGGPDKIGRVIAYLDTTLLDPGLNAETRHELTRVSAIARSLRGDTPDTRLIPVRAHLRKATKG